MIDWLELGIKKNRMGCGFRKERTAPEAATSTTLAVFVYMASPQKENGYTAISNEIMEALSRLHSIGSEAVQVLFFVLRYTYGFQRKEAKLSVSFIQKGVLMKRSSVSRALKRLSTNRLIARTESSIKFNKNYDEWVSSNRRTIHQSATRVSTNRRGGVSTERRNKKENSIKKTIKKTPPTPPGGNAHKELTDVQKLVHTFFSLKGWKYDPSKQKIFLRFLRPAKDLLDLCDGVFQIAENKLKMVARWADAKQLDWTIETVIKKWFELDQLDSLMEDSKKPFIDGDRAYQKGSDWFVILPNGEHKKYIGALSDHLTYESR